MPDSAHGFNLGDDVMVRAGATVTRLDEALNPKGTTKLTVDTNLGKIWKIDVGATLRAKDTFNYPFYRVEWADINKKGSILDKVGAEFSNLLHLSDTGAEKFVGSDGFGEM